MTRRPISETWEQLERGRTHNRLTFDCRKLLSAPECGDATDGQVAPKVRVVRAAQDMVYTGDRTQHPQHRVAERERRVPVEPAEGFRGRAPPLRTEDDVHLV